MQDHRPVPAKLTWTDEDAARLHELLKLDEIDRLRSDFYEYCQWRRPKMYTPEHVYLRDVARTLQAFMQDELIREDGLPYDKLMFVAPPRHGKTLTIENLCQWVLGRWPDKGIITASYNELLSSRLARNVRDCIQEEKAVATKLVYSDIFPKSKVKQGDGSMQLWSLEGQHFSFLASSPGGTMTGIGAQLLVIDDLIKNYVEACNERVLEEHFDWYDKTTESRLEAGAKQIIMNTLWASKDISGRCLEREPGQWKVIKLQALNEETGEMLAEDILSRDEFERRRAHNDPQLIAANYQQEPYDLVDKLYPGFKTYLPGMIPPGGYVEAYVDTADEGQDFLAGAVYNVVNRTAYIIDLVYTQKAMEYSEQETARMLVDAEAQKATIESNNGGRGFARNVERIMRETLNYAACHVVWFHQSENKRARILSNATNVCNSIIFPEDWQQRWPQFARDVTKLSKSAKWLHEDHADMLTGIVEKSLQGSFTAFFG